MSRPDWNREGRAWPHRDTSAFVPADGLRWHVQKLGEGPVALLLHGTGAATHSWRGLLPLLAKRLSVVSIDLPGHGFTTAPAGYGFSLPAIARSVATLGVDPAIIIGHSAGAAIAARMTLDAGTDTPIVAINGALLPFPGFARTIFPALAKGLFLNPVTPRFLALQAQSRRFVRLFLERSTGSRVDVDGAALYQSLFAHSAHIVAALGMMASWDLERLERDLPSLRSPLLLVAGDKDAAVPPSVAGKVAKMAGNADVLHLPGVGHLAHEETPRVIADAIFDFAERHAILPSLKRGGGDDSA